MELAIIYSAVFVAGLIIFERLTRSFAGRFERSKALNYRLKLLESAENNLDVYKSMIRERAIDYDASDIGIGAVLRRIFVQSGLKFDTARFGFYGVAALLLTWLGLGFVLENTVLRTLATIAIIIVVPALVLLRIQALRIRKFEDQLPGALDVASRSLLAGHPLPTALAMISRELPDPVGTEFGILSDELTYGTDLDDAMLNMVERVGSPDLKLLAVSMSVQRGTGGNFVEILENLSSVIRERGILRAKIKSLSAEGRITAWLMTAFPFLLYFIISSLAPTYFDPVWQSGYAGTIMFVGGVIMLIGNFILYRLVNFEF